MINYVVCFFFTCHKHNSSNPFQAQDLLDMVLVGIELAGWFWFHSFFTGVLFAYQAITPHTHTFIHSLIDKVLIAFIVKFIDL